jgi:hypothetical protein
LPAPAIRTPLRGSALCVTDSNRETVHDLRCRLDGRGG